MFFAGLFILFLGVSVQADTLHVCETKGRLTLYESAPAKCKGDRSTIEVERTDVRLADVEADVNHILSLLASEPWVPEEPEPVCGNAAQDALDEARYNFLGNTDQQRLASAYFTRYVECGDLDRAAHWGTEWLRLAVEECGLGPCFFAVRGNVIAGLERLL